tara:strand:+ start:1279 stop:1647 length:369 start_codon:yes stop_codon:yes gene_type:complete
MVSDVRAAPLLKPASVLLLEAYSVSPAVVVGTLLPGAGLASHAGADPAPVAVRTWPSVAAASRAMVFAPLAYKRSPVVVSVDAGEATHSGAVAPEFMLNDWRLVPFASLARVLAAVAYTVSP